MSRLENIELLNEMIAGGYITKRKHHIFDLYILNYSEKCQFEKVWNDVTCICRGLIVDSDYNIISRPFVKFFNYEELDSSVIPDLPFQIYEKIDGSLGISYVVDGNVFISTRGSFDSEQALWATKYLNNNCKLTVETIKANPDYTFIFEIVYPEDKKVVNYHGLEALFLTAVIVTENGKEVDIDAFKMLSNEVKFPISYDAIDDWKTIRDKFDGDNKEGFVVKFENNYRVKMKFEQYFRLNSLKTSLTYNKILTELSEGRAIELAELINEFDEENVIYYRGVIESILNRFKEIYLDSLFSYKRFETDKDAAEYFKTCKYPQILFALRNGKDVANLIWKIIKQEK